jgi:hypothetical protein
VKLFSGLIERIDDWMNPIVVKELRQAVKSKVVIVILLLLLLVEVFILGAMLLFGAIETGGEMDPVAGRMVFLTLQGVLLGSCLLLIPLYAGFRLASERSSTNVDLLFTSTLKPRAILWGKFLAATLIALLIFSACAPFMTFTYLLRGLDVLTILLVVGVDLLVVLVFTMGALFLASIPGNRGLKVLLGVIGFIVMCYGFGGTMGFSYFMVSPEVVRVLSWTGFSWVLAGFVAGGVLLMGLFFVWATALLSPPSSNRALAVRLYQLFVWLALGAIVVWLSITLESSDPLGWWEHPMFWLFALQIVISINERDTWGPRVTRAIPRRPLSRLAAFFFYSGAGGGILYGALMLALTIGLGYFGHYLFDNAFGFAALPTAFPGGMAPTRRIDPEGTTLMVLGALYVYCYAMTALWVRLALFGDRLRSTFTWLLFVILLALGNVLPFLPAVLTDYRSNFFTRYPWVGLPSPMATLALIHDFRGGSSSMMVPLDTLAFVFTVGWAVLVTVLCMPWFGRQFSRFRPTTRRARQRPLAAKDLVPVEVVPDEPAAPQETAPAVAVEKSPHVMPAPADGQGAR